jgi:hypothetical protein
LHQKEDCPQKDHQAFLLSLSGKIKRKWNYQEFL